MHGHVDGFFNLVKRRTDVEIAGIFDPSAELQQKYAAKYGFAKSIFYTKLDAMLDAVHPDAVAAFTSTYDHPAVVKECAARKTTVMMEKPLAVDMAGARAIEAAARASGIAVIINYETTWYPSHGAIWKLFKEEHAAGEIRKMVAMDGHEGPQAIRVGPEFLKWLTDPVQNGAGALFDFGCYGANLMTWLMDNRRPVAVTAVTQHLQPSVYPNVDDEADVLVEYPGAIGIIQASWNWPTSRKDFEVYGQTGYAIATGGTNLRWKTGKAAEQSRQPEALPADEHDSVAYLVAVVRGRQKVTGLSSLKNNVIATEILTAARESAKSGKRVELGAGGR